MELRWALQRQIAVGSRPSSPSDVEELRLSGIRAVLSLERVAWHVAGKMREAGMLHATEELEDYGVPTYRQMDELAALLDGWLEEGRAVYIHCYAGVGRSRTVAASYLAVRTGDVQSALDAVGLPETAAQQEFVRDYFLSRDSGM